MGACVSNLQHLQLYQSYQYLKIGFFLINFFYFRRTLKMKHLSICRIDHLPDEVILLIFDYSSGYDLTTSFQRVCTRWKYLINKSERIWRGEIKLKGITEQQCKNKLCEVLKQTPRLKYLQIGNCHLQAIEGGNCVSEDESEEKTEDILQTLRIYNKDLEYLHIIDRFPLFDLIHSIVDGSKFKRLKITLNKLCDRREKINDLKKVYVNLPDVDNMCIDFCQRIQFYCEKKDLEWDISHDFEPDSIDEFI